MDDRVGPGNTGIPLELSESSRGQGHSSRSKALAHAYAEQGFVILPQVIPIAEIDALLGAYLRLVCDASGRSFGSPFGEDLVAYFEEHPEIESQVYNDIRKAPWCGQFARLDAITNPVREILGTPIGLFKKIPFRIDMPRCVAEIAHWHQDYFYVKGNTDVITAWVPMQDTRFLNGCLSIMPRSHRLGPIEHDLVIGKKRVPASIFQNEIRMVELRKGDLLLFHSLLLHSGNLNLSPTIRYSLQPRYTPLDAPADTGMGGVVSL